ncbi:hypothetical protein B0H14DRAFT_2876561 [Mycena olivaceomarginata]|nr:hypothetical protein B0H14DRAFT_2876561 [Mycena olivaceomarginata]
MTDDACDATPLNRTYHHVDIWATSSENASTVVSFIFTPLIVFSIPHDAQTVPPPPYYPEPPNCMFYGWVLEPELFGPGTIVLRFDDGSTTTFKHPTTAMQAYDTFEFVVIALRLMSGIHIEWPTDKRPRIASFAEAIKDVGVRSRLDDGDKMPPAAIIKKLEETLHLVKKPEWIETTRWSTPVRSHSVYPVRALNVYF